MPILAVWSLVIILLASCWNMLSRAGCVSPAKIESTNLTICSILRSCRDSNLRASRNGAEWAWRGALHITLEAIFWIVSSFFNCVLDADAKVALAYSSRDLISDMYAISEDSRRPLITAGFYRKCNTGQDSNRNSSVHLSRNITQFFSNIN